MFINFDIQERNFMQYIMMHKKNYWMKILVRYLDHVIYCCYISVLFPSGQTSGVSVELK